MVYFTIREEDNEFLVLRKDGSIVCRWETREEAQRLIDDLNNIPEIND